MPGLGRGPPGRGPAAPGAPVRGPGAPRPAGGRGIPWLAAKGLLPGRGAAPPSRGGRPMPWLGAKGLLPGRGWPGRAPGRGEAGAPGPPWSPSRDSGRTGAAGAGAVGAGATGVGSALAAGVGTGAAGAGVAGAGAAGAGALAAGALAAGALAAAGAGATGAGLAGVAVAAGFSALGAASAGGNFSLTRRTTGASTVELALLTYSPISFSRSRSTLLVTPSSLASALTRTLDKTSPVSRGPCHGWRGPSLRLGSAHC